MAAGFVGIAATAACSGDATAPTQSGPTPNGNYTMTTVNGQALPFATAHDANYTYEVTAGSLALTSDGKFSVVTTWRQTIPQNISTFVDSTGGTWTQSASIVKLAYSDGSPTDSATWAGTQLTFVVNVNNVTTTTVYTKK